MILRTRLVASVDLEKLRSFVINPNTINAKYINFVFSSLEFKRFFQSYIDNHFVLDYQKKRDHKIKKIIQSVYNTVFQNASQLSRETKERIEKNAKFKLPWSNFELVKCIESTKAFIDRVTKKASRDNVPESEIILLRCLLVLQFER